MKFYRLLRSSSRGSRLGQESCNPGPEKQEEAVKDVQREDKGKKERKTAPTNRIHRLRAALRRCWVKRSGRTRILVPPTTERDCLPWGFTIDADEWRVVQGNFTGPVGQWYEPDDMDKPDVFVWRRATAEGGTVGIMPVPQYRPESPDGNDEIDMQVRAVMDAKLERDPMMPQRYCAAQMAGVLDAVGLVDPRHRLDHELETGQRRDLSGYEWVVDIDKLFVLRERISPLSLLSPPPGY
jgi:hypothetical protein